MPWLGGNVWGMCWFYVHVHVHVHVLYAIAIIDIDIAIDGVGMQGGMFDGPAASVENEGGKGTSEGNGRCRCWCCSFGSFAWLGLVGCCFWYGFARGCFLRRHAMVLCLVWPHSVNNQYRININANISYR